MKSKRNEKRPLAQFPPIRHKAFIEATKNGFVLWADVGYMSKKDSPDYRWIIDASTIYKNGMFYVSDNHFTKELSTCLNKAKKYKLVKEKINEN